jgi:23S rRNA (uracil1939-C5)-methyltransferase
MQYPSQLEAKRRIVGDAIERIARRGVDVPPVTPSPAEWEYRNKLTLTLRRTRTGWLAGLHAYDDPGRVFDLAECPITHPHVVGAWHEIRAAARWLPNEPELRGAVRLLGDDLAFLLEGGAHWPAAATFVRSCPSLTLVRWHSSSGHVHIIHDRRVSPQPAASFEQVNPPVADMLRASLIQRLGTVEKIVDAYAGNGTTASILARRGASVTAIEVDPEAASYAAGRLPAGSRVITARVEDVLAEALPADVVILNPPRTGVDRRVAELLERSPRTPTVMYVSCNPATLARDLGRMPSYRIALLEVYDMFPQTAHVETLCQLVAEAA